jgi:hypothetical protein
MIIYNYIGKGEGRGKLAHTKKESRGNKKTHENGI